MDTHGCPAGIAIQVAPVHPEGCLSSIYNTWISKSKCKMFNSIYNTWISKSKCKMFNSIYNTWISQNHTSELERHAGRHSFWKLRQKCKCIEWITRTQKQNRKSETKGTGAAFRKICCLYYYDDDYYHYHYHYHFHYHYYYYYYY